MCTNPNVNVVFDQKSPTSTGTPAQLKIRAKLAEWGATRLPRISNDDPLALHSGRGGATPGVLGVFEWRTDSPPMTPGPQPFNGGITPGFQADRPGDGDTVTRDEFNNLFSDVEEIAAAVATLLKDTGVRA